MRHSLHRSITLVAIVALTPVSAAHAQHAATSAAKPTLASADYAKWESLGGSAISADGKWIAYDFRRGNGSTELRYRAASSGDEHSIHSATGAQFTSDGRWLLATVTPDTAGGGRGARGGRGGGGAGGAAAAPPANRNKVAVVDLRSDATRVFDDVQSYSLSTDGSHVAFRRYATPGHRGADVIVRDLAAGTELAFGNVAELAWDPSGSLLAMAIDVDGKTGNGVQVLNIKTGALSSLDASDAEYSGLVWRPRGFDLAAMRSRADSAFVDTAYTVIAWRGLDTPRFVESHIDQSDESGGANPMRIADYRAPQWSDDGKTIFFGMAPREPKVAAERRAPGELPPARVEVWHWKDVREFHQQAVSAAQDRQRTTLVAWQVGSRVTHLSNDPLETVQLSELGNVAVVNNDVAYGKEYMSGRAVRDVYTVDPVTGSRTKILTRSPFGATLSPSGRYALYQQDNAWWAMDLSSGARANLTGKAKSTFVNMEDDHPVPERRAYGLAGFTSGEKTAIVYDRFDLWQVSLDGSNATRLTRGREDSTVYRCASEFAGRGGGGGGGRGRGGAGRAGTTPCQLDNDNGLIDPAEPLLLVATGEYNKKSGYASVTIGQSVDRLVWTDKMVTGLRKAADADVYLVEQQTFEESPNLFVAGPRLADLKQVSHTNAFQSDFAWGKQELMNYTNKHGDKLQMMLTYPANYEPGKKYPMVVYYYEGLSQGFHQYVTPNERNPYNTSVFSQNGYFVLRPDIVFQARNPGYSGLDCVTSAVRTVESRVADIDAKHVGNMGHSWGGYQSAFYAVHNPGIFAATIAGAPLTDLISMYGYTSGNSGLPETGHYETSQERMQVPLWEDPQAYIRNSTVYAVDSLHTPLLLEEGDADGNVNHFQSEELYNFGRRLGKNVVYLVYEGENHNVARPESQADYLHRQLEWFGYYLKGEPAPAWITDGESYAERQKILNAPEAGAGGTAVQAGTAGGRGGRRP